MLQRIDLCDRLQLAEGAGLTVEGFLADTLVRRALDDLAAAAGVEPRWRVRLKKRIPLAAGLGGGSADAAAALVLANRTLAAPFPPERLTEIGALVGADVPFFLTPGPKLAEGVGEKLTALELPQDYWVVVALPRGVAKASSGAVYARFDELGGGAAFPERCAALVAALATCRRPLDLALLPANDLAEAASRSPVADELLSAGAFRADLSGAGPAVYGLFEDRADAQRAARRCRRLARAWVAAPVW